MKAFVTGGTGLLGSNLVKLLVAQGHEIKALVRSMEKAKKTYGNLHNITIVQGDMENVAGFAHELAGCDVLFHTAAYFREYFAVGDHWQTLEKINVTATLELLSAAEQAGVKTTIHTSSSGVIGMTTDGSDPDESTPADNYVRGNLYFKSKLVAEEKIQTWLKSHKMPVIFINPTAMYGPGDAAPTRAGQMILDFVHGKIPALPPGGFNCVDVRDVAQAMITAVHQGKSGERYIINNGYFSVETILGTVGKLTGKPLPALRMPYQMALMYAHLSEFVARLTRTQATVPVSGIKTLNNYQTLSHAKARQQLDFNPRQFDLTIRDELQWYLDNGYIHQNLALKPLSHMG